MLPNKCFLLPDIVWTKLHSGLFDLNSLRQLKIIAVESKSISRPVNNPLFHISSNYPSTWQFSAETTSLWEENTTSVLLGYWNGRHAAVRCQCWILVSVPSRDELPWLPSAPSLGFNTCAPYSLWRCLCLQWNQETWRTTPYKRLFSACFEQIAFVRSTLMDGVPTVGCG